MKNLILVFSLVLNLQLFGNDFLVKTNPRTYQINVQTTIEHWGMGNSEIDLFLAYLSSNEYQTCHQVTKDTSARIIHLGTAGDSCIYYNLTLGRKLEFGKKVQLKNEFILEVADVSVNLDAIHTIYPYALNDPNFTKYTGSNLPYIDVKQKELLKISEMIWGKSSNSLEYAKNCFLYVAKSFQYGLPLSGFKSLAFTLENNMGDCGNLNSVFITLLRMKAIPARHLMGFRPDGSLHVWADFYLANYGWIPIDITYKQEYPTGDYFGKIEFENSGFIVQRGIGHEISALESPMRIPGLQTYTYQVNYTKAQKAKVYIDRVVTCEAQLVNN